MRSNHSLGCGQSRPGAELQPPCSDTPAAKQGWCQAARGYISPQSILARTTASTSTSHAHRLCPTISPYTLPASSQPCYLTHHFHFETLHQTCFSIPLVLSIRFNHLFHADPSTTTLRPLHALQPVAFRIQGHERDLVAGLVLVRVRIRSRYLRCVWDVQSISTGILLL